MLLSLDLGSARIGLVAAHDVLPIEIIVAHTIKINPELDGRRPQRRRKPVPEAKSMADAVTEILDGAKRNRERLTKVVIEHQRDFYAPPDKSPQDIAAMVEAHEVCTILHDRIGIALRELGLDVVTIPRASWAHRVVPHHRGGIGDREANEALRANWLTLESWEMLDGQDECDAAGALVWALSDAPKKSRRYRYRDRRKDKTQPRETKPKQTPEERKTMNRRCALRWYYATKHPALEAKRSEAGCKCDGKRHRNECPLSKFSRQLARAAQHGPFLR